MRATKNKTNVQQLGEAEAVFRRALELFVEHARGALAERGSFYVAVSGGHTPSRFFELLGSDKSSRDLGWENIQLFWVDERCVPPEARESNYRLAAESFLPKVGIPAANVHRIHGECCDYGSEAREYEATIRKVFGVGRTRIPEFDLIILGMGKEGHTGSLFPDSYAVYDTEDLVCVVYQMDGLNRITLTHPVLKAARRLIILVTGTEKSGILKEVFENEADEARYPIHALWPALDRITWLVDKEAARFL
ncbi:MAG: 6-phosphogluconolactonase [Planctomycetota bacterium]